MPSLDHVLNCASRITNAHDCLTFAIMVNQHAADTLHPGDSRVEQLRRALREANLGLQRYMTEIEHDLEE